MTKPAKPKRCTRCRKIKPPSAYYAGRGSGGRCKECFNEQMRCVKAANPEHYRAHRKAYAQTEAFKANQRRYHQTAKGKRARKESTKRWYAAHPEVRVAHNAISHDVHRGKLTRQPCEVCGATPAHAHHPDYSKPRKVKWLCDKHHYKLHGKKHARAAINHAPVPRAKMGALLSI